MPFENDIVTGAGKLLVPAIRSPNYIPGTSGWTINRDGSAEFQNALFRGPVVVIDPITGLAIASIGANGNIAGQYATIENDIILNGQSLGDRLQDGRGLVGFFGTFGTPTAPGNGSFTDMAWFRAPLRGNRLYFISCTPLQMNNSAGFANHEITHRWVVTDTLGNGPAVYAQTTQTVNNSPAKTTMLQGFLYAFSSNPLLNATTTFQLQSSATSATCSYTNVGGWNMYCLDWGPLTGTMNQGGIGTAAGASQRTTIYEATNSQSYLGNGTQFLANQEAWRSDFGDGKGNTSSIIIFPGATIRSDLTGASIQSATLSLYCVTAEESNGTLGFSPSNATAPPGTQTPGSGATYAYDDDWPNPGWYTINILGNFLTDIIGGSNSMILNTGLFGLAATRFYGFANPTYRPYITITYTK